MTPQIDLSSMTRAQKEALLRLLQEKSERQEVVTAKNDLIEFAKQVYPGYSVGAHHRYMAKLFKDVASGKKKRIIVNLGPRHGKQLAHSTPVLTTVGWKTHGELRVGDEVFHPNGFPVRVVALSDETMATMELETTDGEALKCHENHEWLVRDSTTRTEKVVETKWFLQPAVTGPRAGQQKKLWYGTRGARGSSCHYQLPFVEALQFDHVPLLLDPYVLGVWLGDGTAGKPAVTMGTEDLAEVMGGFEAVGLVQSTLCVHSGTGVPTAYFSGPRPNVAGELTRSLQALGIYKTKRIPEHYLRSSVAQRLQLLAGLVDTDGHVEAGTGRVRVVTVSRELAEDIIGLCTTLGFRPYLTEQQPSLSTSGIQGRRVVYTVGCQPTVALPTRIKRKQVFVKAQARRVGVADVRYTSSPEPGRCIQVDSPDGLYLVGRTLVPTHNSELTSYLFPAWFLGQHPNKKIIMATHTASLSEDFGRRVRNLIDSSDYARIFSETKLAQDSKGAGQWNTSAGGSYYAVGVGGALAGRGADLLIIDDAHSEQDAQSGTRTVFDQAWSWYQMGPRQRLQWGGAIIVVMCMTGDTPVLLANGTEKPLRDIRAGDEVATYERGALTTAKVLNWKSSGIDSIYKIRTQSGKILRANERHPFLVEQNGERQWIQVRSLKPGMCLVAKRGAVVPQDPKQSPGCVDPAKPQGRTTRSTLTRLTTLLGTMVSGWVRSARMVGVQSQPNPKGFASYTTPRFVGQTGTVGPGIAQKNGVTPASKRAMALRRQISIAFSEVKMAFAQCVRNLRQNTILARTGITSCASIMNMQLGEFEGYSATTATSRSATQKQQQQRKLLPSTFDFTTDQILEISPDGREEVFDLQVARTENFIANGVVSHNTRWSLLDLTARLLQQQKRNPRADQWEVVEFPAILNEYSEDPERPEKSLWPEKWDIETLRQTRETLDVKYWNAQYQQNPTSEEGALIKRDQWRIWEEEDPPVCNFIIQSWDTAHDTKSSSDYSACTTWGVFDEVVEEGQDAGRTTPALILLDAFKKRMEFPLLKKTAYEMWQEWRPDAFVVEKKAAGGPLLQELRMMGIPAQEFSPSRGNDKTVRVNAIADLFKSGKVYAPHTRWAQEVIEECAAFPHGENDDFVDTVTQALLRFRQGGFVSLDTDWRDEPKQFKSRRYAGYY